MLVQVVDQQRGPGLGASFAAACLGVSPYLSPIGAWLVLKGRAESTGGAPAEWGQILEPVVRGYYAARHRYDRPGEVEIVVPTASIYHPDHPWLRATPDGIVRETIGQDEGYFDRHLVECKTVDSRLSWHWGLDKRRRTAPPHYRIQSVVTMAVTSLPMCEFAVLCGGNDYFEVTVERDLDLEAMTIERLAQFWDLVQRDEPPDIDEADEWRTYFADRLPTERTTAIAGPHIEQWVDEWKAALDIAEAATKRVGLAKNQILAAAVAANANTIKTDHGPVLVVQPKGKRPYVRAPQSWGIEE